MATVQQGLQAQIRNIEATYGKPISEWTGIISASGLTKHTDVVTMLKKDYGMTHGAAHRVSLVAREKATEAAAPRPPSDPVSALYTGKKASLRPLHDALMTAIQAFGDDIETAPKKGYLSLRRRKQFAMIQPSAVGRINLGLILRDVPRTPASNPPKASTPCSPTESGSPAPPISTRNSPPGSSAPTTTHDKQPRAPPLTAGTLQNR